MAGFNSGVFTRTFNWTQDAANGVDILPDRMDTEDNGFASGLSNTICRDGQSTITQNIPFNSKKITGLGNPTDPTDAVNLRSIPATAPTGRLTLAGATPVLTTTTSAVGTVYYTPYIGATVPLWNGSSFTQTSFAELTNSLASSSSGNAGPAAAVAGSLYDLFVWSNSGVVTLTRGPVWQTATARDAAAGTLTLSSGYWTNTFAITNGPGAGAGTYVGTFMTDAGGATVTVNFGSSASGGGQAWIGIWNAFNRVWGGAIVSDSSVNHTYTSNTLRAWNASATARTTIVRGLQIEPVVSYANAIVVSSTTGILTAVGIGLDSTTAFASSSLALGTEIQVANNQMSAFGKYGGIPGIGQHYLQVIEGGAANVTFQASGYGGGSGNVIQFTEFMY